MYGSIGLGALLLGACVGDEPVVAGDSDASSASDTGSGSDADAPGDASSAGDAASDAGRPFDPSVLGSQLAFWYRGESITSPLDAGVALWPDQSMHSNTGDCSAHSYGL